MVIGKRIRQLRISKKISQQKLGDIIGVTKVSISYYENNIRIPTIEVLIKIADYFETTVDYILGREKKVYSELENKYIGYISEQDIEIINELKHYHNLYNNIIENIPQKVKEINLKIK